jgi:hypothetical protein
MDLEFSTTDELNELIRQINKNYYERFNANILYLEELANNIYVIYIIELRDAYSHLKQIFDYDITNHNEKKKLQTHLEKYVNHLQNGLLDTFRKILSIEYSSARKTIHRKNLYVFDQYIAQEASRLRIMSEENPIDNRIKGYIELMNYLSNTRKQLEK